MLASAEKQIPYMPPEVMLRSGTIDALVVHGDECARQLLNLQLWQAGYDVRLAATAAGARAMIVEAAPDVLIADADISGMGAFEFVAAVRADETIPFFPVIFLTTHLGAAARARELGAVCLLKPVLAGELLAAVALSTLIQRPHLEDARPDSSLAAANEALFRFRRVSPAHDL